MNPDEFDLEKQKLALDERRVEVEERQARHGFWTRLAIVIPVIAALLAFGGNLVAQRLQAHDALNLQTAKAKDEFEVKVAEIVMNTHGPFEARGRAVALREIFASRLGKEFARNFNPEDATDKGTTTNDAEVASKKELLKLIAEHPGDRQQIIRTWRSLFPGDTWIRPLG